MPDTFPTELRGLVNKIYDKAVEKRAEEKDMAPMPESDSDHPGASEPDRGTREEWSELSIEYQRIFDMFEGYDKPDPADSKKMIANCRAAAKLISDNDDADVSKVQRRLSQWTSHGIDSFKTNVLDKFEEAQARQGALLETVMAAAEANMEAAKTKREEIEKIAKEAYSALDALPAGTDRNPIAIAVGVAFIAGGVVAIPAAGSGIGLVSTGLYLAGSIGTTYNAINGTPKEIDPGGKRQIKGDSVDAVISSMEDAIFKLWEHLFEVHNKIAETCEKNVTELEGNWTDYLPSYDDPETDEKEPDISQIDENTEDPTKGVDPITGPEVD